MTRHAERRDARSPLRILVPARWVRRIVREVPAACGALALCGIAVLVVPRAWGASDAPSASTVADAADAADSALFTGFPARSEGDLQFDLDHAAFHRAATGTHNEFHLRIPNNELRFEMEHGALQS